MRGGYIPKSCADRGSCPAPQVSAPGDIRRAKRAPVPAVDEAGRRGGAQVWALSIIEQNPGIGVGGIASQMQIHQSTASNMIKTLLAKELIMMAKAKSDQGNLHLAILPDGQKLLATVSGPFEGVLPVALGNLSIDTLTRMDQDLDELIHVLKADEAAAETPLAEIQ